jgi:hypothetical protein
MKSGRQVAVLCRSATRRRNSSVKMAAQLATCTRKKSVLSSVFLSSEGVKPIEIIDKWKFSMVMHVCHYSKCTRRLGSSWKALGPTKSAAGGTRLAALSTKRIFSRGIHALPKRWNTCIERNGDYTEKWSHCVPFLLNKFRDIKYLIFKVFIWLTYICVVNWTFRSTYTKERTVQQERGWFPYGGEGKLLGHLSENAN